MQSIINDFTEIAAQRREIGAPGEQPVSLLALHRCWADLVDERLRLLSEASDHDLARTRPPASDRIRLALVEGKIDTILDEIEASPIRTVSDIAVLLDIAIENDGIDATPEHEPWLCHLIRRLRQLAPEAEFTFMRPIRMTAEQAAGICAEPDPANFARGALVAGDDLVDESDPAVAIEQRRIAAEARRVALAREDGFAEGDPSAAARAMRDRCDAATEELSDIEDELADVTATTLPGLKAQVEYLSRLSEGYSRLRVRLCQAAAVGLDAMIEGRAAPAEAAAPDWAQAPQDLAGLRRQLSLIEATLADDEFDPAGEHYPDEEMPLGPCTCRQIIAGIEAMIAGAP